MPRKWRETVAPHIYRDAYGIDTIVQFRGETRQERWPLEADWDELQRWVAHAVAELHDRAADAGTAHVQTRGTLSADVTAFLKDRKGLPSYAADASHLKAWTILYGRQKRRSIRTAHVNRAIATWRQAELSDQTIRHRCRVLRVLWKHLDGKKARTPLDDAQIPKKPHPHPVGVAIATIRAVLDQLDPSQPRKKGSSAKRWPMGAEKTRARYLVLATTLQRPVQLKRAKPEDVDLEHGWWTVRSAKGAPAHRIPLNADMIAAWQAFIAADAWGTFNTHWYRTRIREAGWPKTISTYNYRHAGAMDALERGADLGDLQGLLGHTTIDTTRRAYGPLLASRQQVVSAQLEGRLPVGGTNGGGTSPDGPTSTFPNKTASSAKRAETGKLKLVKRKSA